MGKHFKGSNRRGFDDDHNDSSTSYSRPGGGGGKRKSRSASFDAPTDAPSGPDIANLTQQRQPVAQNRNVEPEPTSEPEEVTVKWFNAEKGFGFVKAKDDDLFLHISAMRKAGLQTVEPDQKLLVQRGPGKNGKDAVARIVVE
jgi:CspA family cold shock protein